MKDKAVLLNNQAILFDFDGVIVESVDIKTKAFASLFKQYGEEVVKKVIDYHLKNGGVSRYEKFRHYLEKIIFEPVTENRIVELGEKFSEKVVERVVSAPYVKGIKKILEELYLKIPLFIVSGTPQDELQKIVEQRGIGKYFKECLGSPVKKGPHIKQILNSYGYDQNRILFIGDTMTDYKGAGEAGVNFIGRVPEGAENPFPDHIQIFTDFH